MAERTQGETADVLHDQLVGGLANVTSDELDQVVIAYEPVWAIGTGNNALPHDVEFAVKKIRGHIKHLYGKAASEKIRVLYGGSATSSSAADYLKIRGVDGLLVGSASLKPEEFASIVNTANQVKE